MKHIPLIALTIVMLLFVAATGAFAQADESSLDESSAALSIIATMPATASVEVDINGQLYTLAIPVTVNIDAQQDLAEALLTTPAIDRVGDVRWVIVGITEYEEEFELNDFQVLSPSSPDNKLVVIESDITNLDSEPFTYYINTNDRFAYDDLGNFYAPTDQECSDINPGDTQSCFFVFDVPITANILGMDVEVLEHKRITFVATP